MRKALPVKRHSRQDREKDVLIGLVDLYVKQGKPIGSNTLKEAGFEHLSSATIRNYFAKLEIEGYLKQHHASGGRVPTDKAYRLYAETKLESPSITKDDDAFLSTLLNRETKEISAYLHDAVHAISEMTGCVAFLASPRFDQDFVVAVRLMEIDEKRLLAAIVTEFGLVHTEIFHPPKAFSPETLLRIEDYFHFRLTGMDRPSLSEEEETFAKQSYNEIVLRHFVSYTNMQFEDIYKAGFSKLLLHPEFHDPAVLSNTLALFENTEHIRYILQECFKAKQLQSWIGSELSEHLPPPHYASIVAIPYYIHQNIVGVIALLGPDRMPYGKLFGILERASRYLSENLTKTMYKFKLNYRQPNGAQALENKGKAAETMKLTHQKESSHE